MPSRPSTVQYSQKSTAQKSAPRPARTTVLHLSADLEPGIPAREAVDLAVLTQRGGWRALIASGGGLLVLEAERAAVRHTRIPLGRSGMLAGWRNHIHLANIVQKEHPVLIHAHGLAAIMHAETIARTHRVPLVADFSQPVPDHPKTRRLFKSLVETPCVIRAPSDYMARLLHDTFKWPSERLWLIPAGVDVQWCHAGALSHERLQELSRKWRLPEQAAVVVAPMPFAPGGGHKILLEALAQLKRDDVFTVLVGDNRPAPGGRAEIESLVDRNGLAGKVIMPDYCMDWPAACWLSSVIVIPNILPRGHAPELLTAQAIGRPVVATDCGANGEMVRNGETAWLIPPGDVKDMARALDEAIRLNGTQRVELAQRTHEFVAETFPQANWFNSMMDLYESMLVPAARRMKAQAA